MPTHSPAVRKLARRALEHTWPLFGRLSSSRWMQDRWEELLWVSLAGMNYAVARSGHPVHSGEAWFIAHFLRGLQRDMPWTVLDVGANVGEYADLLCTHVVGDTDRLFAFEPFSAAFDKLQRRFEGDDRVHACHFGLSDQRENRSIYSAREDIALTSLYTREGSQIPYEFSTNETVSLVALDEFLQEQDIEHVDFMKLDVEGHEVAVLRGAAEAIKSQRIDIVAFEFGASNVDSRTPFRDLHNFLAPHYKIFRLLQRNLHPLGPYRESYEQYNLANFIAIGQHRPDYLESVR